MDARLEIRLSVQDRDEIRRLAAEVGLSVSEYVRTKALEAALEDGHLPVRSSVGAGDELLKPSASPRAPGPEFTTLDPADVPAPHPGDDVGLVESVPVKLYRCPAHGDFTTRASGARCYCNRPVVAL